MRQKLLAVPMLLLCLLCACGGNEKDPLQAPVDFRAALLAHGGCCFQLQARAESGGAVWELTLDCALDAAGSGTVTVLAPETIAGITAETDGSTGRLRYQTLALGLGTLPGVELAPAAAPGRLVRAWAQDWISSAGAEDDNLLVCYEADTFSVRTRFDAAGVPVRAELAVDGSVYFDAEIQNFVWKAGTNDETTQKDLG